MEEFMNRLADLILLEMERRGCSIAYFADICDISKNEVGNITNRKKKDIYVSTLLKICKNSGIKLSDVFEMECYGEFDLEKFVLTNGRDTYCIKACQKNNEH